MKLTKTTKEIINQEMHLAKKDLDKDWESFWNLKWFSEEELLELKNKCMEWQEKARMNPDLTNSHRDGYRAGLSQAINLIDEMIEK